MAPRKLPDGSAPATKATACDLAAAGDTAALAGLSHADLHQPDKHGGLAVHWAAGSGHVDTLRWLATHGGFDVESEGRPPSRRAEMQAPRRRPLHYAARNGRLDAVRYLLEEAHVQPEPRARHGVTPFQLAVWQNWLDVARHLVEKHSADPRQVNDFACGAAHWLGTAPPARAGDRGLDLLPLARYLLARGIDWHAPQRQGHTPLHKAAWGGQLALCKWLRDECGSVDDAPDLGGNFAADEADMGGHAALAEWLRAECSGARASSCAVLRLPPNTTDPEAIRAAYHRLARRLHPDRVAAVGGGGETSLEGEVVDFEAVAAAYDHLTRLGGRGAQANPTHSLRRMLQATGAAEPNPGGLDQAGGGGAAAAAQGAEKQVAMGGQPSTEGALSAASVGSGVMIGVALARSIFKAKLAAVAHEYDCSGGLPISKLRRKYAQVWRGEEVPAPEALGLAPRTQLVELIRSFSDVVSVHEDASREGKQALVRPLVSRDVALGIRRETGRETGAAGGVTAAAAAVETEEAEAVEVAAAAAAAAVETEAADVALGCSAEAPAAVPRPWAEPLGAPAPDAAPPPVILIGGGIGGLAAALALQAAGVRCVVYERDAGWEHRRRGYGLTLSNAGALAALGIESAVRETNAGCASDAHWVFDATGAVLGYFGIAFTRILHELRGNLRVPRQVLRRLLVERLRPGTVRWGWKLNGYTEGAGAVSATLERVADPLEKEAPDEAAWAGGEAVLGEAVTTGEAGRVGEVIEVRGCLLVGADGVRSAVRSQKVGDAPRYVGVAIVLGECRLAHPLLHEQGFYTVDGTHRMFTMPLEPLSAAEEAEEARAAGAARLGGTAAHSTMWQVSLSLESEEQASDLCARGGAALLAELQRRCAAWHEPVAAMLAATDPASVWGTPLLDRAPMPLRRRGCNVSGAPWASRVTVLGDAAHPMTPFKGQGANMTLADAPLLAKFVGPVLGSTAPAERKTDASRLYTALACFEREMMSRAQRKVEASREAARTYHSAAALQPDAYGVSGVPPELLAEFLADLTERGLGAACAEQLEPGAVAAWEALQRRAAQRADDGADGAPAAPAKETGATAGATVAAGSGAVAEATVAPAGAAVAADTAGAEARATESGQPELPMRCSGCARAMEASAVFTSAQRRKPDATRRCRECVAAAAGAEAGGGGGIPAARAQEAAAAPGSSAVRLLRSRADLDGAVRAAGDAALVVLEFGASWCRECTKAAPFYEQLALKEPGSLFCRVDVDKSEELTSAFGASALPLFVFLRRGKKVDSLVGAQQTALRKKVLKHANA